MAPTNRVILSFNLCVSNLIGAALFLAAAYDLQLSTKLGATLSEFCGVSLLIAILGVVTGAYRLALWAQVAALAGPVALLRLFLSEITPKNAAGMHFLIVAALFLLGYFVMLALGARILAHQKRKVN